jgi:Cu/Ag efflux protein CusF
MWRVISGTMVVTTMLALGVGLTSTQSQQISPASGSSSNGWTTGLVEGTVKSVDPQTGTVHVSTGLFGFLGKTLQLSEGTEVQIDGRLGSLTEIREGAKVKVVYEVRDGKKVATYIELTPRV